MASNRRNFCTACTRAIPATECRDVSGRCRACAVANHTPTKQGERLAFAQRDFAPPFTTRPAESAGVLTAIRRSIAARRAVVGSIMPGNWRPHPQTTVKDTETCD